MSSSMYWQPRTRKVYRLLVHIQHQEYMRRRAQLTTNNAKQHEYRKWLHGQAPYQRNWWFQGTDPPPGYMRDEDPTQDDNEDDDDDDDDPDRPDNDDKPNDDEPIERGDNQGGGGGKRRKVALAATGQHVAALGEPQRGFAARFDRGVRNTYRAVKGDFERRMNPIDPMEGVVLDDPQEFPRLVDIQANAEAGPNPFVDLPPAYDSLPDPEVQQMYDELSYETPVRDPHIHEATQQILKTPNRETVDADWQKLATASDEIGRMNRTIDEPGMRKETFNNGSYAAELVSDGGSRTVFLGMSQNGNHVDVAGAEKFLREINGDIDLVFAEGKGAAAVKNHINKFEARRAARQTRRGQLAPVKGLVMLEPRPMTKGEDFSRNWEMVEEHIGEGKNGITSIYATDAENVHGPPIDIGRHYRIKNDMNLTPRRLMQESAIKDPALLTDIETTKSLHDTHRKGIGQITAEDSPLRRQRIFAEEVVPEKNPSASLEDFERQHIGLRDTAAKEVSMMQDMRNFIDNDMMEHITQRGQGKPRKTISDFADWWQNKDELGLDFETRKARTGVVSYVHDRTGEQFWPKQTREYVPRTARPVASMDFMRRYGQHWLNMGGKFTQAEFKALRTPKQVILDNRFYKNPDHVVEPTPKSINRKPMELSPADRMDLRIRINEKGYHNNMWDKKKVGRRWLEANTFEDPLVNAKMKHHYGEKLDEISKEIYKKNPEFMRQSLATEIADPFQHPWEPEREYNGLEFQYELFNDHQPSFPVDLPLQSKTVRGDLALSKAQPDNIRLMEILHPKGLLAGAGAGILANSAFNLGEEATGWHMGEAPRALVEGSMMGGLNFAGLELMGMANAGLFGETAAGAAFLGTRYGGQQLLNTLGLQSNSLENEVVADALGGAAAGALIGGVPGAAIGGALGAGFGALGKGIDSFFN